MDFIHLFSWLFSEIYQSRVMSFLFISSALQNFSSFSDGLKSTCIFFLLVFLNGWIVLIIQTVDDLIFLSFDLILVIFIINFLFGDDKSQILNSRTQHFHFIIEIGLVTGTTIFPSGNRHLGLVYENIREFLVLPCNHLFSLHCIGITLFWNCIKFLIVLI